MLINVVMINTFVSGAQVQARTIRLALLRVFVTDMRVRVFRGVLRSVRPDPHSLDGPGTGDRVVNRA